MRSVAVPSRRLSLAIALVALSLMLSAGCSERAAEKQQADEKDHLKTLTLLFGKFTGSHGGAGPANEQQFKQFLKGRQQELTQMGRPDIDSLFVSPRDGKPYVISYGLKPGPLSSPSGRVIAYESEGVGGKRFVAYEMGFVEEMDDAKFQSVVSKK